MKRTILILMMIATYAVTVVSAYNPYAPNQFDTMEKNTWEYQYVYDLSRDGLTGADMSKFSSSYTLTRYEMTQFIAAAKERRNQATPQQQEKIDKLCVAFSDDLGYVEPAKADDSQASQGQSFDWKGASK
ncbi:MAG: hypothetical protein LKF47_01455 [Megasphaera sp.]|nr:hypothetical protein [Megasphaera sp.]